MTTFNASLAKYTVLLPQPRDCSCVRKGIDSFSTSGFLADSAVKN